MSCPTCGMMSFVVIWQQTVLTMPFCRAKSAISLLGFILNCGNARVWGCARVWDVRGCGDVKSAE